MRIGIILSLVLLTSCQLIYDLNPKAYEEWLYNLPTDNSCQVEFYKKVDPKYYPACRSGYGDDIDTVWIDTLKNK